MSIIEKVKKAPLFNIKDQIRSLERNFDRIQKKGETVVIGLSIDPQPEKNMGCSFKYR
ncbi:hypothetical protein HMPREF3224_00001 [Anaerococcus hydrogenalis]|nr:hypothetical protein HMPREF3224_00001 [Anaerococcus hydrogenalis]